MQRVDPGLGGADAFDGQLLALGRMPRVHSAEAALPQQPPGTRAGVDVERKAPAPDQASVQVRPRRRQAQQRLVVLRGCDVGYGSVGWLRPSRGAAARKRRGA